MPGQLPRVSALGLAFLGLATGCSVSSPLVQARLKLISAGHTGCLPDDNEITNVSSKADGSGIWNATCKGRTYLCTAVGSVGNSESFSCAPVPQ